MRSRSNRSNPLSEELPRNSNIHVLDYNCCIANTHNNIQCSRKPCLEENYCFQHLHSRKNAYDKPEHCPICMESLDDTLYPLSCGHWGHRQCILKWKDQCPICKNKIYLTQKERKNMEMEKIPAAFFEEMLYLSNLLFAMELFDITSFQLI